MAAPKVALWVGESKRNPARETGWVNKYADLVQQGRMTMPEKESEVGNRSLTFTCDFSAKHAVQVKLLNISNIH